MCAYTKLIDHICINFIIGHRTWWACVFNCNLLKSLVLHEANLVCSSLSHAYFGSITSRKCSTDSPYSPQFVHAKTIPSLECKDANIWMRFRFDNIFILCKFILHISVSKAEWDNRETILGQLITLKLLTEQTCDVSKRVRIYCTTEW